MQVNLEKRLFRLLLIGVVLIGFTAFLSFTPLGGILVDKFFNVVPEMFVLEMFSIFVIPFVLLVLPVSLVIYLLYRLFK